MIPNELTAPGTYRPPFLHVKAASAYPQPSSTQLRSPGSHAKVLRVLPGPATCPARAVRAAAAPAPAAFTSYLP